MSWFLWNCFCPRSYTHVGAEEPEDGEEEMEAAGSRLWLCVQEDLDHMNQLTYEELQQVLKFSERNIDYQRTGFDQLKTKALKLETSITNNESVLVDEDKDSDLYRTLCSVITKLKTELEETQEFVAKEKAKLEPLVKLNLLIKTEMARRPRPFSPSSPSS